MNVRSTLARLAGLAAALLLAGTAHAQSGGGGGPKPKPLCGLTASGATAATIKYDPFGSNGLQSVEVPLAITRKVSPDSPNEKTQQVYFVMTMPADAPNYQMEVYALGSTTTTLGNVLYRENDPLLANKPTISNSASNQINYNFGGASQPDTVIFNLRITVPAGTDLRAGQPISFGIRYVCDGTGGMQNVTTQTNLANAVSIDVRVMSALRAYYAGSVLDFGEIGTVPNPIGANVVTTSAANHFGVLSSGAYSVALKSDNGFQLKNGGAGANNMIAYQLNFLGQPLTSATPNATTQALLVNCRPAGITPTSTSYSGDRLYIQGKLLQGGQGKNPAPNYSDVLTVTFTPLIDANAGSANCNTVAP